MSVIFVGLMIKAVFGVGHMSSMCLGPRERASLLKLKSSFVAVFELCCCSLASLLRALSVVPAWT